MLHSIKLAKQIPLAGIFTSNCKIFIIRANNSRVILRCLGNALPSDQTTEITSPNIKLTTAPPEPYVNKKKVSLNELLSEDDDLMTDNDEDEDEMEEMFAPGPTNGEIEWGGPTRGGKRLEPTRYGDWDRNGRVSDF